MIKKAANKILVVEDSRAINDMLVRSLMEQLKIDAIAAFSLQESKEIIKSQADDIFLALLDLNLPDAPNGEIVDFIQSKGIPVIVLTGSLNDDIHDSMLKKGVLDYVVKRNLKEIQGLITTIDRLRKNHQRRVLVVDDSASARSHIRKLLENHFFNVIEACDGLDALEKLKKHDDILLVITDYNMPKMNGAEFIVKAREQYSREELIIIGISSHARNLISVKLLKSGANDFMIRPFIPEEFYCRINQNIDTVINYRTMRDAANKDYLTGLYNRKYVFETGEKLYQNAQRQNIALSAAMLDIDFFKHVNDTYGHHVGDLALKHIADIISSHIRHSDIVARMGGEEFSILTFSASNPVNESDACTEKILERIRISIMNTPLQADGHTINMTISIGYCTIIGDNLNGMFNNADHALYVSKENGRNRVTQFK